MSNVFNRRHLVSVLCLALLSGLPAVQAAIETTGVTVRVKIRANTCVINKNNVIEVNFGNDVLTTRVDGVSYKKKPLVYSVSCDGDVSNYLIMWINGTGAEFDNTLLATNMPDLAIALFENGDPYPLNSWLAIRYATPPRLEAVLAKRPGITLKGGLFSSGATMRVEYL